MLLIIWTLIIVAAICLYFRRNNTRFSKYDVRSIDPVPIFGNMGGVMMQKQHFVDNMERIYNAFSGEKFVGVFEFVNPVLMVKDIELLKKITIKDFEHFLDHRTMFSEDTEPFLARTLITLKGQEWKDMRSTLSPAFTSAKIRGMVPLMTEVGDRTVTTLRNRINESGVGYIDMDTSDLTTRFANDVIASCAFGLNVNSLEEKENHFFKMGQSINNKTLRQMLTFFGYLLCPQIMSKTGLTLLPGETRTFFSHIILKTMRDRETNNIIRPDMIHLLMEAKKGKLAHEAKTDTNAGFATAEETAVGRGKINREWSDNDLIAQTVLFFIAGFETISTTTSFALHELAVNPDVQEKLVEEIKETHVKNGGKIDYNSIQNMKYMDMVVSEVLRLWPPAGGLDRVCAKDYNVGRPNRIASEDYIIRKGEYISVPVFAIHRDSKYFPDPLKFDPERFSDEKKHKIQPFTYLPFGLGPRNCIGSRFALTEVKVMLYQFLQHFEIHSCEKTNTNRRVSPKSLNLFLEGGHWIRMKKRN